jgi:hypothetical protein
MQISGVRRRWFQLHLLTAIVMMFTASILMWLNLLPRVSFATLTCQSRGEDGQECPLDFRVRATSKGWPFWTVAEFTRVADDGSDFQGYTDFETSNDLFKTIRGHYGTIQSADPQREYDAGIAVLIVCAVAGVCEILLRARERQRNRRQNKSPLIGTDPAGNASWTTDENTEIVTRTTQTSAEDSAQV